MELIGGIFALLIYFIPAIIAFCRSHKSKLGIFLVNLIFGWTMLGWLWALIWSVCNPGQTQVVIVNGYQPAPVNGTVSPPPSHR